MLSLIAPFHGPPPTEVPLPRAPLVQVVSQIMFPAIFSISNETTIAPFQERIRTRYPITEKRIMQHFELTDGGVTPPRGETIWRFSDSSQNWSVSLASSFVALSTRRYTSRDDFVNRLTAIAAALQETVDPQIVLRFGLRYVDRIEEPEFARLHELIREDFVIPTNSPFAVSADRILSEAQLKTEEGASILARWGVLPSMVTMDPESMPPVSGPSFIFDLDMFSSEQRDFNAEVLGNLATSYARRIYAVFRFMIKDAFLTTYGGQL